MLSILYRYKNNPGLNKIRFTIQIPCFYTVLHDQTLGYVRDPFLCTGGRRLTCMLHDMAIVKYLCVENNVAYRTYGAQEVSSVCMMRLFRLVN